LKFKDVGLTNNNEDEIICSGPVLIKNGEIPTKEILTLALFKFKRLSTGLYVKGCLLLLFIL
jgi:hypothetical protein